MLYKWSRYYSKLAAPILIILTTTIVTGCSSLLSPVKVPEVKTYQITVSKGNVDSQKSNQLSKKGVLRIEKMKSASPFDSNHMYYTMNNLELNAYAYSQWVTSPNNMLNHILFEQIAHANLYQATISPLMFGQSDYKLNTELLELTQHIKESYGYTSMKIFAQLIDNQTGKVIKQHLFAITADGEASPTGMVLAINQSTNLLIQQMIAWLSGQPIPETRPPITEPDKAQVTSTNQKQTNSQVNTIADQSESTVKNTGNEFFQLY